MLGGGPHEDGLGEVSQKHLVVIGPEGTLRTVDDKAGDRAPHADVGKDHRVGHQFAHGFLFGEDAPARGRLDRCRAQVGGVRIPVETHRVTVKAPLGDGLEAAGGIPRALAFDIEEGAVFVEPDPARAAQTTGKGDRFS